MNEDELPQPYPELAGSYLPILLANKQMIAWEYLRRNQHYRHEYYVAMAVMKAARHCENYLAIPGSFEEEEKKELCEELRRLPPNAADIIERGPSLWGLVEYESPLLSCENAVVHWLDNASAINAEVTKRPLRTRGKRLDPMTCGGSVYCTISDNGIYMTIRHSFTQVTIRSKTAPFPRPHENLKLNLTPSRHLSEHAHDIFDRPARDGRHFFISPSMLRARKHVKILRVLDGHLRNYKPRAIAEIIYGRQRVKEEWRAGDAMRKDIENCIEVGLDRVNGGYRKLLKSRSR
jgi:hypothetical protein